MNTKRVALIALGIGAGMTGCSLMRRRMRGARRMPNARVWQRALAKRVDEVEAALLLSLAQTRYESLYERRPRFDQRALRMHLEQNILPGIALYQVLREQWRDETRVANAVDGLFRASAATMATRRLMPYLRRVPRPFKVFRGAVRQTLRRNFPPEGWDLEWIENSESCVAFDIHRCFYQRVLTHYGVPELTQRFCQLDDELAEALPPSINWERTHTLGRGYEVCNFRWYNLEPVKRDVKDIVLN